MNPRAKFRQLLAEPGIISQPVVYDGLGARLAEEIGFQAVGLGGYAMGASLAVSEPLVSLTEVARFTRQITLVTDLPVMVDAGAGYGEPLHVMHTVRELEQAGAASVHIEDQIFPKRVHYHKGVEHIVEVDEMTAKLRGAQQGRSDPDFVIVARTDAMRTDDYDEGIRRARAYMDAGADMIMMFPNNEEETKAAPGDLPGVPLAYVNSPGNRLGRSVVPLQQLEEWGWKVASDATSTINVAARAQRALLTSLFSTGRNGEDQDELIEVRHALERTIGLERYYEIEEQTVES
jgi:methylisocitrate lyase